MRLADRAASELAHRAVDSRQQLGLGAAGVLQGFVRQEHDPPRGHVTERLGGCAGIGARHVGHAVVKDVFLEIGGIIVGGGAACLGAAALVDGDIHQDTSRCHLFQHLPGN